jgi:ABC-type lipoprotein export system ATPase subunit
VRCAGRRIDRLPDRERAHLQRMELLVDAARAQGTSVLMVTHEPRVAAYAGRTMMVRDGVDALGLGLEAAPP